MRSTPLPRKTTLRLAALLISPSNSISAFCATKDKPVPVAPMAAISPVSVSVPVPLLTKTDPDVPPLVANSQLRSELLPLPV
ncbi:hypothetical protein D3C81_2195110 [compost metagenome]